MLKNGQTEGWTDRRMDRQKDGQTEGWTDMKLTVAFRNFANAPKNSTLSIFFPQTLSSVLFPLSFLRSISFKL
jgi:hypothetical protein